MKIDLKEIKLICNINLHGAHSSVTMKIPEKFLICPSICLINLKSIKPRGSSNPLDSLDKHDIM